ncbi:MAG: type IV pilus modification protein PilV [Pseudomonadota bacterium]
MNTQVPKHIHRRAAGISMVESLVALVVISVGMLGIAGLYMSSLKAGRSASLRVQAVNLASDLSDRIRANREALVAYNMAAGGTGVSHACTTPSACTPVLVAENDLFVWSNAVKAALPAGATGAVTFLDNPAGRPDRYTIVVTWREAGSDVDASYQLVLEVQTT